MKFVWTTIHVSDLDKSIAFYSGLLGLPVLERFQGTGNEIAMLGEETGTHLELLCKPGRPETVGQGVSIGFAFPDIEAMAETLTAAGCQVTPIISPNPNVKFRFVADPDGYQVQLVERKEL